MGDDLGAAGVVLHPGSAKTGPVPPAIARAGEVIAEALAESESCPLHLEITAGAGGTLGRTFAELAQLIDAAGGSPRLGVCLDSCHLLASGYDVRTPEALSAVLDELERELGLDRLGSLHLNDSQFPLGSNRDRHANLGDGELGETGCAAFVRERALRACPACWRPLGQPATARRPRRLRTPSVCTRGSWMPRRAGGQERRRMRQAVRPLLPALALLVAAGCGGGPGAAAAETISATPQIPLTTADALRLAGPARDRRIVDGAGRRVQLLGVGVNALVDYGRTGLAPTPSRRRMLSRWPRSA